VKINLTLLSSLEIKERFNTRSQIPFKIVSLDKKRVKIKFKSGNETYIVSLSKTGKFSSIFDGFFDLVIRPEYKLPLLPFGTKIIVWNNENQKKECYFAGCGLNGEIGCTFLKLKNEVDINIIKYFKSYKIIEKGKF